MKTKIFSLIFILSTLFTLGFSGLYYYLNPSPLQIAPKKLNVINQKSREVLFINKTTEIGKDIINKVYGRYASYVIRNDYEISMPNSAEYTIPTVLALDSQVYAVRESPTLRYKLWQKTAPDIVLLGSSMFFMGFNREIFYKKYPEKYLLDFTTGDNTPIIAKDFLSYIDTFNLKFKSGTIFCYGVNHAEMMSHYTDHHNFVREQILKPQEREQISTRIARLFGIPDTKKEIQNLLPKLNAFIHKADGHKIMPPVNIDSAKAQPEKFKEYILSSIPSYLINAPDKKRTVDNFKAKKIDEIIRFIEKRNGKIVFILLPVGSTEYIAMKDLVKATNNYFTLLRKEKKIQYLDFSIMDSVGLSDIDFIREDGQYDAQHLNLVGSRKFTNKILDTLEKLNVWK